MKTINTADATDAALDWLVAKCEGFPNFEEFGRRTPYSTDWAQGGPIYDAVSVKTSRLFNPDGYVVMADDGTKGAGLTRLIAAMRCFVASKLGDTVEVPEELL